MARDPAAWQATIRFTPETRRSIVADLKRAKTIDAAALITDLEDAATVFVQAFDGTTDTPAGDDRRTLRKVAELAERLRNELAAAHSGNAGDALSAAIQAVGYTSKFPSQLIEGLDVLDKAINVADRDSEPRAGRPRDHAKIWLAHMVRLALKRQGVSPTLALDGQWAKTVRQVLQALGAQPADDLRPLLKAARQI